MGWIALATLGIAAGAITHISTTEAMFTEAANPTSVSVSSTAYWPPHACGPLRDYDEIIYGTAGPDRIVGDALSWNSPGVSVVDIKPGGGNNQIIVGTGGHDLIFGGAGNDCIVGSAAGSVMVGGTGNDVIIGGAGDDLLAGGTGGDRLYGGAGEDVLCAGAGTDTLVGGPGQDWLFGEQADSLEQDGPNDPTGQVTDLYTASSQLSSVRPFRLTPNQSTGDAARCAEFVVASAPMAPRAGVSPQDVYDDLAGTLGRCSAQFDATNAGNATPEPSDLTPPTPAARNIFAMPSAETRGSTGVDEVPVGGELSSPSHTPTSTPTSSPGPAAPPTTVTSTPAPEPSPAQVAPSPPVSPTNQPDDPPASPTPDEP